MLSKWSLKLSSLSSFVFFFFALLIRWFPSSYLPNHLCIPQYHLVCSYSLLSCFYLLVLSGSFLYFLLSCKISHCVHLFFPQVQFVYLLLRLCILYLCFISCFFPPGFFSCSFIWNKLLCCISLCNFLCLYEIVTYSCLEGVFLCGSILL